MSSLFHARFYRKRNFVVSRLKHLTPKTTSKMWSTNVVPSKLTSIIGYFSRFQALAYLKSTNKTVQMFNISVIFKDTDHLGKLIRL